MIGSGFVGDGMIEMFAVNDLGLLGLAVKNGVFERFSLIEDLQVGMLIQTDGDRSATHGIGWAMSLDLVDDFVELDGQVVAEDARFLPGENACQVIRWREWTMSIQAAPGSNSEAAVEVLDEFGQIGVASFPRRDSAQAQFLGQAVLQGLVGTFNTALGLWRVGADDLDVQFLHGPSKLR